MRKLLIGVASGFFLISVWLLNRGPVGAVSDTKKAIVHGIFGSITVLTWFGYELWMWHTRKHVSLTGLGGVIKGWVGARFNPLRLRRRHRVAETKKKAARATVQKEAT